MDIDLNIATDNGSVSVENTSKSVLLVRVSDTRTLREIMRKRTVLESIILSKFGQSMLHSFDTKVILDGQTIALFEGLNVSQAKKLYIGWQYLLAKFGF